MFILKAHTYTLAYTHALAHTHIHITGTHIHWNTLEHIHTEKHTHTHTEKHTRTNLKTHLAQQVESTARGDAGSIPAVGIDFKKKNFFVVLFF